MPQIPAMKPYRTSANLIKPYALYGYCKLCQVLAKSLLIDMLWHWP